MNEAEGSGYLSAHLRSTRDGLGYTRGKYARKAWQTFAGSLPTSHGAPILEIGPGECEFAEFLQAEGYGELNIVDTSPEVIQEADRLGIAATLVTDTAGYLDDNAKRFESVLMLHVLEHVPKAEIIPLLSSIRTALAPTGHLLLEVPNMGDPLNGLYFRYADFTHEVGFTEDSLRYVLRQAGFSDVEFLTQAGATGRLSRVAQMLCRKALHAILYTLNLPNGRQMRRRIDPVLSIRAAP